ncbi:MAG: hypothetical protein IGBAC_0405 [Ignavibacteriae bacterium]|nr:MAG: hypothetical protein IGBAC_0405 [Ignavibacteriota bacterium]
MKLATTYQQKLKNQKGVMYLPTDAFNFFKITSQKESKLNSMFHIINNNKQQKEDL